MRLQGFRSAVKLLCGMLLAATVRFLRATVPHPRGVFCTVLPRGSWCMTMAGVTLCQKTDCCVVASLVVDSQSSLFGARIRNSTRMDDSVDWETKLGLTTNLLFFGGWVNF
mmetsp:Transcript_74467/g.144214  ORF Transcript_74467/g.144214 Transcript_74467/m.144214 type:complete len:111 (+) Transcript_74467:1524-1856(+)